MLQQWRWRFCALLSDFAGWDELEILLILDPRDPKSSVVFSQSLCEWFQAQEHSRRSFIHHQYDKSAKYYSDMKTGDIQNNMAMQSRAKSFCLLHSLVHKWHFCGSSAPFPHLKALIFYSWCSNDSPLNLFPTTPPLEMDLWDQNKETNDFGVFFPLMDNLTKNFSGWNTVTF